VTTRCRTGYPASAESNLHYRKYNSLAAGVRWPIDKLIFGGVCRRFSKMYDTVALSDPIPWCAGSAPVSDCTCDLPCLCLRTGLKPQNSATS